MSQLTSYVSGSAGVSASFYLRGEEDDVYHSGANKSRFEQVRPMYKYTQSSMVLQSVSFSGHSSPTGTLIRSAAYLHKSYTIVKWPGLIANEKMGITKTSYINGRGFYYVK